MNPRLLSSAPGGSSPGVPNAQAMGAGAAGAGIFDALFKLFGGDQSPSGAANNYLDQIPDVFKQYLQSYITRGQNAGNLLQGQYSDLVNDPGSILARIGKGYQQSPGFQFQQQQGLNSINNAAAAGGMAGSMGHQQQAGALSTNLANQNYNQYLQNAMGLYGRGLSGEQGFDTQGYNTSTGMAGALANLLNLKGQNAFNQTAANNQDWGNIFGDIGAGAGAFLLG